MSSPHPRDTRTDQRRRWMSALLLGCGTLGSAIIGLPALVAAFSPALRKRRGPSWRPAGRINEFTPGRIGPVEVDVNRDDWASSLQTKTVFVWRRDDTENHDTEFVVYSRNCTDLSCPLVFDAGSECFFCPCHGGIFGKDGRPMVGPPNQPLFRYATRIRDNVLEIDLSSLPPMT